MVNQSQRTLMLSQLRVCLDRWQQKWWAAEAPELTLVGLDATHFPEPNAAGWYVSMHSDQNHPVAAIPAPLSGLLANSLLAGVVDADVSPRPMTVLAILEGQAWIDLLNIIRDSALGAGQDRPVAASRTDDFNLSAIRQAYDGLQCIECRVGDQRLFCIYLWPEAVESWFKEIKPFTETRRNPIARLSDAVESEKVSLNVQVGRAEITVEELTALSIGHVIRLNRKLDKPVDVHVGENNPVCRGYLGAQGHHIAVKLAKRAQ